MSDMDKNKLDIEAQEKQVSAVEITRRRFLGFIFGLATALGLGAFAAPLVRYAYPVLKGDTFAPMQVATITDLEPQGAGVKFEYMDIPCHLIEEDDETYAAFSMICTHLGCIVKWQEDKQTFHCPCHAGEFDSQGAVIAGPPPRPLDKLIVNVEGSNIFIEGFEPKE